MGQVAVLVNGIPGAGKSTLARVLGPELGFSVISKDAIKEALADLVTVDLPTQRIGALAADAMWSMVGMIDGPTLVESFWASGRDEEFFKRGLRASGVEHGIEVWCEVPLKLARSRFMQRPRHRVHTDVARLEEWEHMVKVAHPISDFPTLQVDTTSAVDVPQLAATIRRMLNLPKREARGVHIG